MKTQVCIIGGGPAGMMLSHILHQAGVESVVVERQSRDYVLGRIRAGVLEAGSVDLLRRHGLAERMDREGKAKDGALILWEGRDSHYIDCAKWTGQQIMAWGQTSITQDLYDRRAQDGGAVITEAANAAPHDVAGAPFVTFEKDGRTHRIDCDYICGCDGFYGPSRQAIPKAARTEYERVYPFGWLGIMVERPPLKDVVYAYSHDGMAVATQRNPMLSRYYVQAPADEGPDDWPDDRFWETLLRRFPSDVAAEIQTGPSIEKSMAPLRSFVSEPMRYGKLFLAGDAAHIVPPTGAKGLNLAFSDVFYLSRGLIEHYKHHRDDYLDTYSEMALRRVWTSINISWRLTKLLHTFPGEDPFETRLRQNDYDMLLRSEAAQALLAWEYVGMPLEA